MTNFQIDEMAIRFQQSEEALYNFFVNDYKSTIEDMPTNEQRDYWDKYHQLVGHLEFCRYMIERYYEEINSRLTYNRNLEQQHYIKSLRKYIIDLGGDPTNCSYILSSEI